MDLTSDQAAKMLGITGGALRQIENNVKPVSLHLAFRAERLYKQVDDELTVDHLIVNEDPPAQPAPEPDRQEQPAEPKVEPTAPPGRRNGRDDRTGPPRTSTANSSSVVGAA